MSVSGPAPATIAKTTNPSNDHDEEQRQRLHMWLRTWWQVLVGELLHRLERGSHSGARRPWRYL